MWFRGPLFPRMPEQETYHLRLLGLTVSTTVLVGGQELDDDEEGQIPHLNLSATDFWR